jgi:DNA-binding beta-propeller fold protein YncE
VRRLVVVASLLAASSAFAQVGPGLGNRSWSDSQVFTPVGFIESPEGHGNVTMVQGYLMTIYSSDGGGNATNGGIEFWDVSDPTAPRRVAQYDDADTHGLREAHGFSLAWYGARLLLAAQGVRGIQLWDVTNPQAISLVSDLDLPGIDRGDYSGDWWTFWQAPYLYVAGVDRGLYVVDASDPAAPVVAAQVPTGDIGGVSPAQVFALGNLAVVMQTQGSDFASLDISIPDQPRLLTAFRGRSGYSHLFAGDGKVLTSGNVPPRAHFFQVSPTGAFTYLDTAGFYFDSGGYGSYQDGVFHSGFSDDYRKFTISPAADVGSGSSGRADRDEDFATVLGNLVFAGDDHGVGTALIPHQRDPDTRPPVVEWMHPPAGATGVALTSRVGLSFSDHVDAASLDETTIRLEDDAGNPVPALRSAQMGLVNLAPLAPLGLLRTYTVIAEGVRDVAGNPSPAFTATFTTGDGSVPMSPTAAITNVDVNVAFGSYAIAVFDEGAAVYSDRDYTFTRQFPARFARQAYLQTANVDKNNILTDFLSFELLAPAEVAFLYDQRASGPPRWLSGFSATGEAVVTTDATFDVYSRRYGRGVVELGGNQGRLTGADSMYSVVIVPDPVPCAVDLSPVETGTVTLSAQGPAGGGYAWQVNNRTYSGPTPQVYLPPGRHGVRLTVTDGPLQATCGGVKVAHHPLVAEVGRTGRKLAWHAGDTLNVNPDNGTVTRVGVAAGAVRWRASGLARPVGLAVSGGAAWVVDQGASAVVALDLESGAERSRTPLGHATRPVSIVAAPDGALFVTLSATGEVARLHPDGALAARRVVTPTAHGLTWFGGRLYVTRFRSSATHGEVHVVDPTTLETRQVIELAFDPGPDTEATGRGVPNYVAQVEVSPDGRRAYVASKKDNVARGLFRDGQPLTFESRVRTIVSALDLGRGAEDLAARLDINDRDMVQSTLTSPQGDLLFVLSQGGRFVDVFDTATRERAAQFEVGQAPQDMALDPATGTLAVYNYLSRSVSYFDVSGLLGGTANAPERRGEVVTVEAEALDPFVLTGKRVFFDAADERMSRDGYISCASCHMDGDHDGQVWDFTQAGEGLRNTIALNGRAGLGHGRVHWTANFDELQDFENDIRGAFGGKGFLSDADFAATEDPLGAPKLGLAPELDALAAYVATLAEAPPSPHRRDDGGLRLEARRGRVVFVDAGCATCHGGEAFTDGRRHDVGTASIGSGQGIGAPLEGVGFDTPTLLGLWDGAPFLHDGSAATVDAALARHGGIPALEAEARADLIAYLLALDSTSLAPEADCAAGPDECVAEGPRPDAGVEIADAGAPSAPDGGVELDASPGTPGPSPAPADGCRCARPVGDAAPWALLGLLALGGQRLRGRRGRGRGAGGGRASARSDRSFIRSDR